MQAELTFDRLILAVDDYGRLDARPQVLKAQLFPLRDEVKPKDVAKWVRELAALDDPPVCLYEVAGRPYLVLTGWEKHRGKGRRATESKYPEPPEAMPKTASAEILGSAVQSAETPGNPPVGRGTRSEKRGTRDEGVPAQAPGTSDWAEPIAARLLELVGANVPGARKPKSPAAWATEIRRIEDDPAAIASTVEWLYAENQRREYPFVVQSGTALREKYGRIQAAMRTPSATARASPPNHAERVAERTKEAARNVLLQSREKSRGRDGEGTEARGPDGDVPRLRAAGD